MKNLTAKISFHQRTWFLPSYEVGRLLLSVLTLEILGFVSVASHVFSVREQTQPLLENKPPKLSSTWPLAVAVVLSIFF